MKHSPLLKLKHKIVLGLFATSVLFLSLPIDMAHAGKVTYQYDNSGRLKKVTYPDNSTKDYTLDPAGNRTQVQAIVPTGGVIAFAVQSYTVSEGVGTLQLGIGRTGTISTGAGVTYTAVNGTAVSGSDFTAASGTLSWVGTDVTPKSITLTITNDTTPESTEQFVVNLSAPTGGGVLGSVTQATITINDNDAATFSIANQTMSESAGTATFTVTLSPTSSQTYSVNYASANGTAAAGSDYTGVSGTLNFAANQASRTITVPIASDVVYEGNETFTVVLTGPTNGALLGTATATGTIAEDDVAPAFAINDVSVNENGGAVAFTVTKTGFTALTHAMNFTTVNGTAMASADYTTATGTLTFGPSDTALNIAVGIVNDAGIESDETFTVALSGVTNGATITKTIGTATVHDDEIPAIPAWTTWQTCINWVPCFANGAITLTWTSVPGATYYELQHVIPDYDYWLEHSGSSTSYVLPAASREPMDGSRVRACNANGCSGYSLDLFVWPDVVAPTVPQGLSAVLATASQVNLAWSASTDSGLGMSGYRVYRNGQLLGTTSSTSYSDTTVAVATFYSYTVRAYDVGGNESSDSAAATVSTPGSTAPGAPNWTSWQSCINWVPCFADGPITLTWTVVPGATYYELQHVIPDYDYWLEYSGSSTSYVLPAEIRQSMDGSRVRACNSFGCSAFSTDLFVWPSQ